MNDPTRTTTLRREYGQRLRGGYERVNARIRRGIEGNDAFGLRSNQELPVFRFERDSDKVDAFMEWLRNEERQEVLTQISRNNNPYIRSAYHRGVTHADYHMNRLGIDTPDAEDIFNAPTHRDTVEHLYTRNFEELQGINSRLNQEISRELTEGFAQGLNPRQMARNLTDRVNKIGKTRATTMARTETIRAHSEASLNRYEEMGIEEIGYKAEVSTAGDSNVCPICASLEGRTHSIEDVRTGSFTFDPDASVIDGTKITSSMRGQKRRMPPIHPNCRCALIPVRSE